MLTDTWEIVDMMIERLEAKSGPLGIKFVGGYDEKIVPQYPAVVVMPGGKAKNLHATQTFQVNSTLHLYVYHANLTLKKRERSKADLQLVARIEAELETDYRWMTETGEPRVIFAYVSQEEPGILQPRLNKSDSVISTRMTWIATSQRRF
jgi:hypothetical protein